MSDGLCSHIPRGRSATVYPHVVPSLCFATAPPAVSRAHLPATSTDYPAATDGVGGLAIPRPAIRGPINHCVSTVVLPHTLPRPFCEVSGAPPPAMSIVRRRCWGNSDGDRPAIATPLHAPAGDPTDHTGKRRTRAKSRVSIENRELRLDPGMPFPGN